jgi:hypothetical protein
MRILALALLLGLMLGCGRSDIGEECDTLASTDECESGAFCSADSAGTVCRKSCIVQTDCGAGENCSGISGTNRKSCQVL